MVLEILKQLWFRTLFFVVGFWLLFMLLGLLAGVHYLYAGIMWAMKNHHLTFALIWGAISGGIGSILYELAKD